MSSLSFRRWFAPLAAVAAAGCASTTIESYWAPPDARPFAVAGGERVVAMVVSDNVALRREAEANLADVLDARGFEAVPAYTLIPDGEIQDEAKAKARIEAANVTGAVVLRPRAIEHEKISSRTMYGSPYYGSFWGSGYYANSWAYGPTVTWTDTHFILETVIYDLRQNKVVWIGRSKTTNPESVEAFIGELSVAVADELRRSGVIARE